MLPYTTKESRNYTMYYNGRNVTPYNYWRRQPKFSHILAQVAEINVNLYLNRLPTCFHILDLIADMLTVTRKQRAEMSPYSRIDSTRVAIYPKARQSQTIYQKRLHKNVTIYKNRQQKWYHISHQIAEMLSYTRLDRRNVSIYQNRLQKYHHTPGTIEVLPYIIRDNRNNTRQQSNRNVTI